MNRILCATGEQSINIAVSKFEQYQVVGEVNFRSEVKDCCKELEPDILLISEALLGKESLPEIIIDLYKRHVKIRVVFLCGSINFNEEDRGAFFEALVYAGVYDIVHEDQITAIRILTALDNPKTKKDVSYLIKKRKTKKHAGFVFKAENVEDDEVKDYYDNLYSISSIKPGTGKSFVSTNVAAMIAEYGKKNAQGQRPRVALIEADLQNLSLGTLLQIEDDKYNLKTVMDHIQTIITKDGSLTKNIEAIEVVNTHIKESLKPYEHCKNLQALVGSQLTLQELEDVKSIHYIYLVESIIKDFDVIIIDTNSALTHVTTFPLLSMSKSCYFILNLDFNNVRNNYRYQGFLEKLGILDRVKYVLNEDIPKTDKTLVGNYEELYYTADMVEKDFALEAKVPIVHKTVFLNRIYSGSPIVLDNNPYTLDARYEIAKIANQMWPISTIEKMKEEIDARESKSKKGFLWKR